MYKVGYCKKNTKKHEKNKIKEVFEEKCLRMSR